MVDLTTQISLIVDYWKQYGWHIDVQPTQAPEHAIELAKQASLSGHQIVFAGGGDGTIGEVANGLVGSETILAPVPMGTTNSFARELNYPMPTWPQRHRLTDVMKALVNGRVHSVDVGYNAADDKNGRFWLMWSGVGADSHLVHALEPRPAWSRKLGRFGYSLQGLVELPKFKSIHATVQVDDQSFEDEFVLIVVTNCRYYAGLLPMNPQAKLDDGLYEVRLFRGSGTVKTLSYVTQLLLNRPLDANQVVVLNGRSVRVETKQKIGCHADGDQAGYAPLVSELHPKALRLLVPADAPADLFLESGDKLT
ncbi:MAG: diacylglycerol kinase family protein [Chloroflexota bacterium]